MIGEKEEREKQRKGEKENNSVAFTSPLLVSLVDCAVAYLFLKADTLKGTGRFFTKNRGIRYL